MSGRAPVDVLISADAHVGDLSGLAAVEGEHFERPDRSLLGPGLLTQLADALAEDLVLALLIPHGVQRGLVG